MAKPYRDMLETLIAELGVLPPEPNTLESRHFFSGAALYVNGNIIATWTPVGFGLKLPPHVRASLIAKGEGSDLRYFEKGPVKKEYVLLSAELAADRKQLKRLILQSIDFRLSE